MSTIELGRFGAVVSPGDGTGFLDTAAELEQLGFSTIWLTGGPMQSLDQITDAMRATKQVRVASGIISVDRFDPDDVAALYTEIESSYPGRFVVGLGGAHGPEPLPTLNAYLDRLDAVPVPSSRRVLAALGPKMLDLASNRAAGAFPVLVTPEYTAQARRRLGDGTTLAVEQLAVVTGDPARARTVARGPLGFLGEAPAYQASFRRMGFTQDEIDARADRLVDGLVAWGDVDTVAARVRSQQQAGADHVAVSLLDESPDGPPLVQWRELAERLGLIG